MRPVRIITTAVFLAALAVSGCTSHHRPDRRAGVLSPVVGPRHPADRRPNHALNGWNGRDYEHLSGHSGQRQLRPLPK
jgi:hypothetical protein